MPTDPSSGLSAPLADITPNPAGVRDFVDARASVLARVARACDRAGRLPGDVTLVAVSKTVDPGRLRAAVMAGLHTLGENRVQEAVAKVPEVPGARWELIGPLQSNKARRALETFARIQTVDSVDLATRLDRIQAERILERRAEGPFPILLQVNVDADPAKAGFTRTAVATALPVILELPNLIVDGLMTVGQVVEDPESARLTFQSLRRLSEELRGRWPAVGSALSMGMSGDFEIAVEEGSTIIRVGHALFGARPGPAG